MPETPETPETTVGRHARKSREGEVIASKMAKTIVVRVERRFRHAQYKKVMTRYQKFYAHDETGTARPGDRVRIHETRPLSKLKCWRVVAVLTAQGTTRPAAGPAAGKPAEG